MSRLVPIPFARQAYEGRSPVVLAEECQNWYLERNPDGAKGPVSLLPTPGLSPLTTVGDGPIRGMRKMGTDLYVVSGNELYVVDRHYNAMLLGEILRSGHVEMTDNGTHVAICTVVEAYAANRDELVFLAESGLNGAAYQDGYGLFTQRGTQFLWWTNLDDMTTISGTDFTSSDALPDNMVGLISDHREVLTFKELSTEVLHNVGPSSGPFVRAGGGMIERGCVAGGTISKADNRVYWLGDDLRPYSMSGYQPQPISTHGIEKLITERAGPQSAFAFTYTQEGHTFYVLTFSDATYVYDLSTRLWHTRKSHGIDRWRANCYAYQWKKHIVGDYSTSDIYELDLDTFDENGDTISRRAVSPPLQANGRRFIIDELYLDMEMGVGLTSGQGSDPQLMLSWSDDAGRTWSNEYWVGAGKIGEYRRRARWHRLGAHYQVIFKLEISDPVKPVIIQAYARIEELAV